MIRPAKEDGARFLVERLLAARDEKERVANGCLVHKSSALPVLPRCLQGDI
jgi:hypothetical protein